MTMKYCELELEEKDLFWGWTFVFPHNSIWAYRLKSTENPASLVHIQIISCVSKTQFVTFHHLCSVSLQANQWLASLLLLACCHFGPKTSECLRVLQCDHQWGDIALHDTDVGPDFVAIYLRSRASGLLWFIAASLLMHNPRSPHSTSAIATSPPPPLHLWTQLTNRLEMLVLCCLWCFLGPLWLTHVPYMDPKHYSGDTIGPVGSGKPQLLWNM